MIELKSIKKIFNPGKPDERMALNDLNLVLNSGDFLIIVGNNGSGKSTLLNTIAGSIRQEEGNIFLEGKNVSSLKEHQRSKWIARIFQNPVTGTSPDLSLLENFRLASIRTKSKNLSVGTNQKFRSFVKEKIKVLGMNLENEIDRPMGSFSGGQRQALSLLMATMDETKVLLMDEPSSALDPGSAVRVMQLASKIIQENALTAILVTHNLKDVINYGNRVIQMKDGKIIKDIRKNEVDNLNLNQIQEWFTN